jgi:hypothetical protein
MKFWTLGLLLIVFSSCDLQSNYRENVMSAGGPSAPTESEVPILTNNTPGEVDTIDAGADSGEIIVDEALYARAEINAETVREKVIQCVRALDEFGRWVQICRLVIDPPVPAPTPNNTGLQLSQH